MLSKVDINCLNSFFFPLVESTEMAVIHFSNRTTVHKSPIKYRLGDVLLKTEQGIKSAIIVARLQTEQKLDKISQSK